MYVIFDKDDDKYSFGENLETAIEDWFMRYDQYPDYQSVTVVQGTEKKFKIDLVDAKPKAAQQTAKPTQPKPVTKPAVKKTVSKSK